MYQSGHSDWSHTLNYSYLLHHRETLNVDLLGRDHTHNDKLPDDQLLAAMDDHCTVPHGKHPRCARTRGLLGGQRSGDKVQEVGER